MTKRIDSRNDSSEFPNGRGSTCLCALWRVLGWGVHALWQMDDTQVTGTLKEQMMHRKTRTMEQILDGLVRGNMRSVEKSALHMKSIGVHLNWYSSSELYESNDERFRQSTLDLIEAAQTAGSRRRQGVCSPFGKIVHRMPRTH